MRGKLEISLIEIERGSSVTVLVESKIKHEIFNKKIHF